MKPWNSSCACAALPPEGPTPPSSAYWVHRSASTVSAHSANCRSATSPFESFLGSSDCALPLVANRVPADSAAPAIVMPFRNERRLTTPCQRDSRSSLGTVAVVSVETFVAKFCFFTFCAPIRGIVLCNAAKCETPPCGRYSRNREIFPKRSCSLDLLRRKRLACLLMFDRLPFASGVHIYAAWRGWIQAIK